MDMYNMELPSYSALAKQKREELKMAKPGRGTDIEEEDDMGKLINDKIKRIRLTYEEKKPSGALLSQPITPKPTVMESIKPDGMDEEEWKVRKYFLAQPNKTTADIERIVGNLKKKREAENGVFSELPEGLDDDENVSKLVEYSKYGYDTAKNVVSGTVDLFANRMRKTAGTMEEIKDAFSDKSTATTRDKTGLGIRIVGDVLGTFNDVLGAVVAPIIKTSASGWKGMYDLLPTDVKEGISQEITTIAKTETGQNAIKSLSKGINMTKQWIQDNPKDAKVMGALIEIASLPVAWTGGKAALKETSKLTNDFVEGAMKVPTKVTIPLEKKIAGKLNTQLEKEAGEAIYENYVPTKIE